jgi:methylisocitrate lyase
MAKKTLREYLADDEFYLVPEIFDCASTRAAEMNGFKMIMVSSSDFSCAYTGIPDLNLLTLDEYASLTERITSMTDMPLFIDADEGFGRPLQTHHACKRLAKAGADSILITDGAAHGKKGLLAVDEAVLRFRAARDGMDGTNCLLLASNTHSLDEDFDEFVERCHLYLQAGADMILPLELNKPSRHGTKLETAKKIAKLVETVFWYPDLDYKDEDFDAGALLRHGYRFTGIHYSFRAAMLAMLDAGRHVFETGRNDYIATAYDHTGYKFHNSPLTCFLRDGKWVNLERKYVLDPEDAIAVRKAGRFTGPGDQFGPGDVR